MTLLHFKPHSKISHKWVHPQTESAVSISYWLIMLQSYCTTHSKSILSYLPSTITASFILIISQPPQP